MSRELERGVADLDGRDRPGLADRGWFGSVEYRMIYRRGDSMTEPPLMVVGVDLA